MLWSDTLLARLHLISARFPLLVPPPATQPHTAHPACLLCCSGLAGPDTSSSEDEDEALGDSDDEEEGGAGGVAAARGLASASDKEEEESSDEEGFAGRQPMVALGGGGEEEEEPLNEEDLEEWGVGALAANPEEPVRHSFDCASEWRAVETLLLLPKRRRVCGGPRGGAGAEEAAVVGLVRAAAVAEMTGYAGGAACTVPHCRCNARPTARPFPAAPR